MFRAHCLRNFLLCLFIFLVSATLCFGQSFSDDFNRADGPVGNGWSLWGNGAVILGDQLETFGQPNVAGGVARPIPVAFPIMFSFDFRTDAPGDGGWSIGFNAELADNPVCCAQHSNPEYALSQYNGGAQLSYTYRNSSGTQFVQVPLVAGQEQYQSAALSHISGTVNADLSSVVTITYPDAAHVTISLPAPPDAIISPQGPWLSLGNSNATYGPHFLDNLVVVSLGDYLSASWFYWYVL